MSKTSNLDPRKIIILYSGNVLSIIAGGKHRRFFAEKSGKEMLREIYDIAKKFKETGEHEYEEALKKYLEPDFRVETPEGYLKDIEGNLYLPETPHIQLYPTVKRMIDQYKEEGLDTTPIINLWKLSLNNPNEQARRDLMEYIDQYGVPVTDKGYMILYKSVRDKNEAVEKLSYFLGQDFFEVRRLRKNPADFWVYEMPENHIYDTKVNRFFSSRDETAVCKVHSDDEGEERFEVWWTEDPNDPDASPDAVTDTFEEALTELFKLGGSVHDADAAIKQVEGHIKEVELQPLGRLDELFREYVLEKQEIDPDEKELEPIFEPYHRGDYGMTIKLGEVSWMPREKCDPDINVECSHGLHVGSYEYVSRFGDTGGTTLACLVNPSDIVALPEYDNSKIRCCAYLPYGIVKKDEHGNWEEAETTYWEEDFIDYEKESLENRITELEGQMSGASEYEKASIEELINVAKKRLVSIEN